MKRVGFVITTPTFGGPHNQALKLYKPLKELGWEVRVITTNAPGNGASRLEENGIPVRKILLHRLRRGFPKQFTNPVHVAVDIPRLVRVFKEEKFDVIQFAGIQNLHVAIAARQVGLPVVCQLLSTYAPRPMRILFSPIVSLVSDVIMAVGRTVAQEHPGVNMRGQSVLLFFPPVDACELRGILDKRETMRARLGLSKESIVVVTLGNFGPQKAHDILVEAAAVVTSKIPNAHFYILGSYAEEHRTYYENTVVAKAKNLGLLDKGVLHFVEVGAQAYEYLSIGDIFVLSSIAEGIPTAMLEAMAMGMPVVSTAVGSIPEVLKTAKAGLVVPPKDPAKIAEQIMLLIEDPELRISYSYNASAFILENVDVKRCAEIHARAYDLAVQKRESRGPGS
jgi:glycosyltransferase involved in cell wall biosynthesis